MAGIINASINLYKIDKSKIIVGAKGKYLNVTIVLNDEVDPYGNQASLVIGQTKEERDAKTPKIYLGNGKLAWTNGVIAKVEGDAQPKQAAPTASAPDDDLPF